LLNMRDKNAGYYHNAVMVFSRVQWEYVQKCYRFPERKMQILKLLFEGLENVIVPTCVVLSDRKKASLPM